MAVKVSKNRFQHVDTAGEFVIPWGTTKVSIVNVGTADALVNGETFPAGASVTFAPDVAYDCFVNQQITYNAQTTTLLVLEYYLPDNYKLPGNV